jgi:hypothetical protein
VAIQKIVESPEARVEKGFAVKRREKDTKRIPGGVEPIDQ